MRCVCDFFYTSLIPLNLVLKTDHDELMENATRPVQLAPVNLVTEFYSSNVLPMPF